MASETAVTLAAGKIRLVLNPSIGGSICDLSWVDGDSGRPILRKCNSESQNVLEASSLPPGPLCQPNPRWPIHLPRARGKASTKYGGRPKSAARARLAEPMEG